MTLALGSRPFRLSAGYRVRRSGTVLILVVVILALMALVGVAYIQVSRTTMMASKKPISGLDAACHSVVGQIQTKLLQDLYDQTSGKLFHVDSDASYNKVHLSPYDYPWTNSTGADWFGQSPVQDMNGDNFPVQPKGGHYDDAWLASSCPDFTSTAKWPHITNLNGIFLRLPALNSADGTPIAEDPINFASGDNTKTDTALELAAHLQANAANYETYGADADGDGILDSRWTWTPLRHFGNLVYVCAVRIIDNSSMININAATSVTKNGDTDDTFKAETDREKRARGYYPSDVDLSRLLVVGPAGVNWASELEALYTYRNVAAVHTGLPAAQKPTLIGLATPLDVNYPTSGIGADSTRSGTWFLNGLYYGKDTGTSARGIFYGISDELELRYKNGLNNHSNTATVKDKMELQLRKNASSESYYASVTNVTDAATFFRGIDGSTADVADRNFPEVRKMLTTRSGAAVFAANPAGSVHATNRFLKYDLLRQNGGGRGTDADNLTRAQNIGTILSNVFSIGAATSQAYLGLTNSALDIAMMDKIVWEYILAIKDYNDADNIPSTRTIDTINYYGIEPILPFIREVYVQTAFSGTDALKENPASPGPDKSLKPYDTGDTPDGKTDTWAHAGSSSDCFAIELGNPFDREINCDKVQIVIGGATYTIPAGTAIGPRSYRIVYVDPTSDVTDNGTYTSGHLNTSLALPTPTAFPTHTPVVATTSGTLNLSTGLQLTVELQVDVSGGTYRIYDRLTHTDFKLESTASTATLNSQQGTAADTGRHRQVRLTRPCSSAAVATGGVHYLSNLNRHVDKRDLPTTPSFVLNQTTITQFGKEDKGTGIVGDAKLDGFMMPVPNRPFFSVAELGKILMIGFTDEATGDLPQRLSGTDGTGGFLNGTGVTGPGRLFLDFSSTAAIAGSIADPIPHAAMVLDQFTTLSPAYDGVNNTTGAAGEAAAATDGLPSEQLIPGLININTAPLHIATLACPLPESINDIQDLMAAIAYYRDSNAATRTTLTGLSATRANPGIAGLGELMYLKPALVTDVPDTLRSSTATAAPPTLSMQRYAQDTTDNKAEAINLYPMPEDGGTAVTAIDGPNERLSRFQFLSQVYTTRSDIFTAYIVVRGYRNNDFGKGPVESATIIAVFDRSGVTSSSGTVKLLAYQVIKN